MFMPMQAAATGNRLKQQYIPGANHQVVLHPDLLLSIYIDILRL
jgi:hypothetical protein